MTSSILISFNDSVSSKAALNFFIRLAFCKEDTHITLLHILRKPTATEELMGKKFTKGQPARFRAVLEKARDKLLENGYSPNNIDIKLVTESYNTVSEGIIDQCKGKTYDMIVIGRKRMTKSEEFVLGDISTKLIRALEGMAILVVKSD